MPSGSQQRSLNKSTVEIREKLLHWYDLSRRDLPWRREEDPYRIWLSEVMLQQTRVATVIPYYARFLAQFPDLNSLAQAEEEQVLKLWAGLGYYARARNFLRAAKIVQAENGGDVPADPKQFRRLPGVGDYTCAAVQSIAFNHPLSAVDGNVHRVLSRLFMVEGRSDDRQAQLKVKQLAQSLLDQTRPGYFNQALMDLGATLCAPKAPRCADCPLSLNCVGHLSGTAQLYPAAKERAALKTVHWVAGLIIKEGKCLVRRREKEGLLQGLWEFPALEAEGIAADQWPDLLAALTGEALTLIEPVTELRHTFTHLRWNVAVWAFEARGKMMPVDKPWRWVDAQEIQALPFPALYFPVVREACKSLSS